MFEVFLKMTGGRYCVLVNPIPGVGSGSTIQAALGLDGWSGTLPSCLRVPPCLPHRPSMSPWPSMGEGGLVRRCLACFACLPGGLFGGG